jgi:predicted nucleotidyltransferase
MIYTLEQIKELVEPIAVKYNLKTLWVFGSYARGEATEESDVDFLIDFKGSKALNLRGYVGMANEIEKKISKKIDMVSLYNLYGPTNVTYFPTFVNIVTTERVMIYERK